MSKKSKAGIEQALGIPSAADLQAALANMHQQGDNTQLPAAPDEAPEMSQEEIKAALAEAKNLKKQLRQIPDILDKEKEIDCISNDAAKYFEDIMDKAFNTEDRFAPELFNSANALLKTALDGKNAIVNAKLKLLDLELKKRKMEQDLAKAGGPQVKDVGGQEIIVADRNSLLGDM